MLKSYQITIRYEHEDVEVGTTDHVEIIKTNDFDCAKKRARSLVFRFVEIWKQRVYSANIVEILPETGWTMPETEIKHFKNRMDKYWEVIMEKQWKEYEENK